MGDDASHSLSAMLRTVSIVFIVSLVALLELRKVRVRESRGIAAPRRSEQRHLLSRSSRRCRVMFDAVSTGFSIGQSNCAKVQLEVSYLLKCQILEHQSLKQGRQQHHHGVYRDIYSVQAATPLL